MIGSIINGILKPLFSTIDKSSDNDVKKEELKAKLKSELTAGINKAMQYQSEVLKTEMTGSKLQRNWRPCLMYLFMAIIADVYLIGNKIQMFWPSYQIAKVPDHLWTLMLTAMTGYIGLRSFDKKSKKLKGEDNGKRD